VRITHRAPFALLALLAGVASGCTTTNTSAMSADRSGESALRSGAPLSAVRWQQHVVGDTALTRSGNSVSVHRFDADFKRPGGGRFALAAADVEACVRPGAPGGVAVSPTYFLVQVGRTTRAPIPSVGVKEPLLRTAVIKPGTCERGWVVFQLRKGDRPGAVLLATSSFIRWRLRGATRPR
jgi:hypothetical protein